MSREARRSRRSSLFRAAAAIGCATAWSASDVSGAAEAEPPMQPVDVRLARAEPGPTGAASSSVDEKRNARGTLRSAADYRALAEREARRAGLPAEVADAVIAVESGYDPGQIGSSGEIGLMQVLPSTAQMLGFVGSASALAVPETNIRYGVTYLAGAWRRAGGDLCTAVMKYRAGHGETRFSQRSVAYCLAVRAKLIARGYPVTGVVPVATFGDAPRSSLGRLLAFSGARCRRACLSVPQQAPLDLDAINIGFDRLAVEASANTVRLR
jgi:soluble lytic murein transglycosylase-like protein